MVYESVNLGIVTVSDRAYNLQYEDKSGAAIKTWLQDAIANNLKISYHLVPDEQEQIKSTLIYMCDYQKNSLIFTTGGTGPALRDVTPEATLAVATKVLDGFGEQMRSISLKYTPTAILSRQVAVVRNSSLIINLPGSPRSISQILNEIIMAVPYCVDLIGGPFIELKPPLPKAHRPPVN